MKQGDVIITQVKARPIILNAEQVRAVQDGRKLQHRVPMKVQPPDDAQWVKEDSVFLIGNACTADMWDEFTSPFGGVGTRLWVKETRWLCGGYVATDPQCHKNEGKSSATHMKKDDSRITLEVTREWAERVQDISEADCLSEGITRDYHLRGMLAPGYEYVAFQNREGSFPSAESAYRCLWDSIYNKKGFGWDTNCWVFGCEWKVVK